MLHGYDHINNVSGNSENYEVHHCKIFSIFLLCAHFLNIQIKVRIYNTVGEGPILYCAEMTLQNETFYPTNQSASKTVPLHSTSHNVSANLHTTPTALRHDTQRTGSEVCMRVISNSISSFNPIQLPRTPSNSDNSRSNHKASQNAGSLLKRCCCYIPIITRYWLLSWQSQYFHLKDARTSFGYSTRKLKSSPSSNTSLRATNSFSRPNTRVTFRAKYVLIKLTQHNHGQDRHVTEFISNFAAWSYVPASQETRCTAIKNTVWCRADKKKLHHHSTLEFMCHDYLHYYFLLRVSLLKSSSKRSFSNIKTGITDLSFYTLILSWVLPYLLSGNFRT